MGRSLQRDIPSKTKPSQIFVNQIYKGRWWDEIDIAAYNAVWGGETAGARFTKHRKPQNATIYADSNLTRLQARYGLVRDDGGNVDILRRF